MRDVLFGIGRLLDAVEDIVGRVMHKQDAGLARFIRQSADGRAVDRGREFLLLFRLIDRRIGSRIHNDVRFDATNEVRQQFGPRKIAPVPIEGDHVTKRYQVSTSIPIRPGRSRP